MFDFPSPATLGQVVQSSTGSSWQWDGTKWTGISSSASSGGPFLPLTGGTISPGPLALTRTDTSTPANAALLSATWNFNWTDTLQLGWPNIQVNANMNGNASGESLAGNLYPLQANLTTAALRNLASAGGNSQDSVVVSSIQRNLPAAGVPNGRRMRDAFGWWGYFIDHTNLPTSRSGALIVMENDVTFNHVDDIGGRVLFQVNPALTIPYGSGGYAASYATALLINGQWAYGHDLTYIGGPFSHSAINLLNAGAGVSTVTSATPGGIVRSVTVDNVMFLESGATGSTYAHVTTTVGAVTASTTLVVADTSYMQTGMGIYDTIVAGGIPDGTTITAIAGNTLTLSGPITSANGATVLASRARKNVVINNTPYVVVGVTLAGAGSTAGTVYFSGNVTVANATNGVLIYPNAHAIWLSGGSDTAPWNDVCFDVNGSATIRSDGMGGIKMTGGAVTVPGLTSTADITLGTSPVSVGLHVSGGGSLDLNGGTGNPAIFNFIPGSANQWWAGAWLDGTFYISNKTGSVNSFYISPNNNAHFANSIGVFGATPPAKPTISGACAGNTAVKALLTALALYGFVLDSTTA